MEKMPLVTVGVASYGNEAYLRETLESIRLQTYPNVELIIVDDASPDQSVAVAEAWLAEHPEVNGKLIRHTTNLGVCRVCNDIVTQAQGEFVCIIGSDDVYLPDKLATQVPLLLNAPPEVGVITSAIEFMDAAGNTIPQPNDFAIPHPEDIFLTLLKSCVVAAMSVLMRRSCFDKVGLYDESLPFEDWDMWLRLSREYKFVYSPKVSARYRRHGNAVFDTRKRQMEEGSLMLLNKHRGASPEADVIIKAQTRLRSELLYQIGSPKAAHWLKVRWEDSRDVVSRVLYILAKLGVPGQKVVRMQRLLGR
ncbi:glycosyltransferase [Hymenobacter sp. BT178]|uniref:Glycosyltransferase n=2 Tax=Hymenobacter lucidus TaxID=2880930 RepID=A0ABS8AQL1_9BACT|nr:glycosyltransferase [Hymenobacter lucidus]